ncbi:MAG: PAS domain S-box protein [Fimbriimonas sp.]|nr:PAS domain S-box protein [Fimbriimonas sp.]
MMRAEREAAVETLRRENELLIRELQLKVASGSSTMYRELLEHAPDAMILVRESGEIEHANIAALELFGFGLDELIGKDIMVLVPQRFREQHAVHRQDYVNEPQRRQMGGHLETPACHKSGGEFLIRAALSAITTPTGLLITCAIRPVEPPELTAVP